MIYTEQNVSYTLSRIQQSVSNPIIAAAYLDLPFYAVILRFQTQFPIEYPFLELSVCRCVGEAGIHSIQDVSEFLGVSAALIESITHNLCAAQILEAQNNMLSAGSQLQNFLQLRSIGQIHFHERMVFFNALTLEPLIPAEYEQLQFGPFGRTLLFCQKDWNEQALQEVMRDIYAAQFHLEGIEQLSTQEIDVQFAPALLLKIAGDEGVVWRIASPKTENILPMLSAQTQKNTEMAELLPHCEVQDSVNGVHEWLRQRGFAESVIFDGSERKQIRALVKPAALKMEHGARLLPYIGTLQAADSGAVFQIWCEDAAARKSAAKQRLTAFAAAQKLQVGFAQSSDILREYGQIWENLDLSAEKSDDAFLKSLT